MKIMPQEDAYCVPGIVLNTLHVIIHSVITTALWFGYYYYHHYFIDMETETQLGSHTASKCQIWKFNLSSLASDKLTDH